MAFAANPPLRWQWHLTLLMRSTEVAGFVSLYAAHDDRLAAFLEQAGFSAVAHRQTPIILWGPGLPGCLPGSSFPGMRARDRRVQTSPAFRLTDVTVSELDALVQELLRNHVHVFRCLIRFLRCLNIWPGR